MSQALFAVLCCACYTGESTFEVKIEIRTEADASDDKPTPYLCTVSDEQFVTQGYLSEHQKRHTGVMHTCSQCEKVFSCPYSLHRHMYIHTSKYKCSVCGKCCTTRQHLAVHSRSHSGEKLFECTLCGKRFSTSGSLVVHGRTHSGEKGYKCHVCDKAFSQSGNLDRHIRVHIDDRPYNCVVCDKAFRLSEHLDNHMRFHTGDRPYVCSLCDRSFTMAGHLQQHKRFVHGNSRPLWVSFLWETVQRLSENWSRMFVFTLMQSHSHVDTVLVVFRGFSNLRHICWSHNNEGTWFTCNICRKKFTTSGDLKKHILWHEDVRSCQVVAVCCRRSRCSCTSRRTVCQQPAIARFLSQLLFSGTLCQMTCSLQSAKYILVSPVVSWHFLFKFSVLNSRGLCNSLGCFSHAKIFNRHRHVKPYVCSECPKRLYTAFELTSHQPVHSEYKQFCCGLW